MVDAARLEIGGEGPPTPTPSPRGGGGATRRDLIAAAAASACAAPALAAGGGRLARATADGLDKDQLVATFDALRAIETKAGSRLGVAAQDLAAGADFYYRPHERFPMCSTFKAMAVAAVLKRVDAGAERLDRFVRYGKADLMSYAPAAKAHLKDGGMTVAALCEAAIELSDNTAANLILRMLGGPGGWTRYVRTLGDAVSRLDRIETALNTSVPGDPRDTTTPAASLADLRKTVLGDALSPASRQRLQTWLVGCKTGDARLRAGLPPGWRVGDKTGTWGGENSYASSNDIAVVWTNTQPILIACYVTGPNAVPGKLRDAAIADVGRLVAATFRPGARRG